MARRSAAWSGTLRIGRGFALIDARIGDSVDHRHLAVQLSAGLDGPIELSGPDGELVCGTVLIGANTHHRIGPIGRHVRSLYVEPQLPLGRDLARRLGDHPAVAASPDLDALVRHWDSGEAKPGLAPMAASLAEMAGQDRPRAEHLMALIEAAGTADGPRDWARALGLSPSRLRASCVEIFGVPPVRLRQWARLKAAARAIAEGAALSDAAVTAGYADQSHFTRQLGRWFGVSPKHGLSSLQIVVEAW